jgi:hypothetical protein
VPKDNTSAASAEGTGPLMERRAFIKTSAILGVGAVAASALPATPASAWTSIHVGAGCEVRRKQKHQRDAVMVLERKIGRRLGIMRRYSFWDSPLPDDTHLWAARRGTVPYISLHAYTRARREIRWSSIANGDHDIALRSKARALRDCGHKIFFSFHHEPENDRANGTAREFIAAHDRVRNIFRDEGATNLVWVATLMASTYRGGHGGADIWLPADYDLVGVDGYNRFPCDDNRWRSFREIFAASRDCARREAKPLFVGEFGCVERWQCGGPDAARAKADWLRAADDAVRAWPQVSALVYSHGKSSSGIPYWIDSSRPSLRAFRTIVGRPFYRRFS